MKTEVEIENPILNSPFREPSKFFRVDPKTGITNTIETGRRPSTFLIPVPQTKNRDLTSELFPEERDRPNTLVNELRGLVNTWRKSGYEGVTQTTRELLGYWTGGTSGTERERPLFYCQLEAVETAIYLAEVAEKYGGQKYLTRLREVNTAFNPAAAADPRGLPRVALKMATGTGKTVVMAMLITWQTLNKVANPQAKRYSKRFLIVTPGLTIRDRLRVLQPGEPGNFYEERDLVPPSLRQDLNQAEILTTNFHVFERKRQLTDVSAATRVVLAGSKDEADRRFTETPEQMVRRVCREFVNKGDIIVINDEAHHCYADANQNARDILKEAEQEAGEDTSDRKLESDEKAEADQDKKAARVWYSGIAAVDAKIGVRTVYDLSATPFFLGGSGYPEGRLFPWVVSDFALIDAIESGIVKVPRLPVAADTLETEGVVYRNLWPHVRQDLPVKGARDLAEGLASGALPSRLEGALFSLYSDYERRFRAWESEGGASGQHTPPVMIIVCQNVAISKMVFDWIAGYEKTAPDGTTLVQKGALDLFDNSTESPTRVREWKPVPNTIIVDSYQLEKEDAELDPAFRDAAAHLIEDFKAQWSRRNPGLDPEKEVKGGTILREVMNTVGKIGKLGEQVRCVVSVSMLTEGWDASTVTHILGIRAFGTQLLCEQVVGRALRRISYAANAEGMYSPEYAEVYGIPFNFIRASGQVKPSQQKPIYKVQSLPERSDMLLQFPRVKSYARDWPREQLRATWGDRTRMTLTPDDVGGTSVELDPFVGEGKTVSTDSLSSERLQTVAYTLARRTLEDHYADEKGGLPVHLYPQLVSVAREWLDSQLDLRGGAFPQLLLVSGLAHRAAEKIQVGLQRTQGEQSSVVPVLRRDGAIGTTEGVSFETTKRVRETEKSHLNYAVLDSKWEGKFAEALDLEPRVVSWVKNFGLDFSIPYRHEGVNSAYFPDFIVALDDGHGANDLLNLIVEIKGEPDERTNAKAAAAETQWIPAVNSWGALGRWGYLEITDPWDGIELVKAYAAKIGIERSSVNG